MKEIRSKEFSIVTAEVTGTPQECERAAAQIAELLRHENHRRRAEGREPVQYRIKREGVRKIYPVFTQSQHRAGSEQGRES